ncbi:MAG: tetratricopeptide repeat protein [Microcoleus sp. PH2017_16_JOR_D_A]|uniref:tetratricopeptide repeat protein n=1 Tax=Microcoleus sp. PH2017_16_JOR_D_A TaxID=2798827 RepID=UPI001DAB67CE|nr:tetratricopeptide repeat protein [Microcoleus sp. PH2017_16_JOR_D_A]MCC3493811.1 tetratricopeptide repeat protein [Microcoleus sp. PH2017_16_JOR_D_A]
MTQNNLGSAYSDRIKFDRGENIERAIECYQAEERISNGRSNVIKLLYKFGLAMLCPKIGQ